MYVFHLFLCLSSLIYRALGGEPKMGSEGHFFPTFPCSHYAECVGAVPYVQWWLRNT